MLELFQQLQDWVTSSLNNLYQSVRDSLQAYDRTLTQMSRRLSGIENQLAEIQVPENIPTNLGPELILSALKEPYLLRELVTAIRDDEVAYQILAGNISLMSQEQSIQTLQKIMATLMKEKTAVSEEDLEKYKPLLEKLAQKAFQDGILEEKAPFDEQAQTKIVADWLDGKLNQMVEAISSECAEEKVPDNDLLYRTAIYLFMLKQIDPEEKQQIREELESDSDFDGCLKEATDGNHSKDNPPEG